MLPESLPRARPTTQRLQRRSLLRLTIAMPGLEDQGEGLKTPPTKSERTTPYGSEPTSGTPVPLAGSVNQRYEILREVGRGGMGIVYRARDRETGELVALKVIHPQIAADPAILERFKNELRLARKITHKNVCRMYELLRFDDVVVIAMEYVEGDSLRRVLDRASGVSTRRGLEWARQICEALREAHAQGIIHRDLKPENILIDDQGQVKVMDFCIARSLDTQATATGGAIGTPAYMSPEQAEGKPLDARSDIYALGLILYEMFTGRRVFEAETPAALAHKHVYETPPAPRSVEPLLPEFLEQAIVKCLEKKPGNRYKSAGEVARALSAPAPLKVVSTDANAAERELVEAAAPRRLGSWERFDWALSALAMAGLLIVYSQFDKVYPFAAMRFSQTHDQAIQKARALVEKYSPEVSADYRASYRGAFQIENFAERVLSDGLRQAVLDARAQGSSWKITGRAGQEPFSTSEVAFDNRGHLQWVRLPQPAQLPDTPPRVDEVLPLAKQYAGDLFQIDVSKAAPTPYSFDSTRKLWVYRDPGSKQERVLPARFNSTPVEWVWADDSNLQVRIQMLPGKLLAAERSFGGGSWGRGVYVDPVMWPARRNAWGFASLRGAIVLGVAGLLCLGLFVARRLYVVTARIVLLSSLIGTVSVAAIVAASLTLEAAEAGWGWVPLASILAIIVSYALVSVPHHYLLKSQPLKLKTFADLMYRGRQAQTAGLAMLRGLLLAAAYLGFHALLLLSLGNLKLAAPSTHLVSLMTQLAELRPAAVALVALQFAWAPPWRRPGCSWRFHWRCSGGPRAEPQYRWLPQPCFGPSERFPCPAPRRILWRRSMSSLPSRACSFQWCSCVMTS